MKAIPFGGGGSGSGSVTSVALVMPGQFAVSGSPVTAAGSLTAAWNPQAANTVLAGPASGASAAPSFRALGLLDVVGLGTAASHAATDFQAAGSYLAAGNNLSDIGSAVTARTNLGLGSAAVHPDTYFLTPGGDGSGLTGITESQVTGLVSDLAAKAPLASPALTGVPTAPTATLGTNNTQIATTAFVLANIPSGTGGAVTSVAGRTGTVVLSTTDISGLGTAATHAATDFLTPTGNGSGLTGITESQVANLTTDLAAKAPLASPTLTGTVTLPAVAIGDGSNIALGTVTGTSIGTTTTQKLGFYGATPIVKPTGSLVTAVQNFGLVSGATIAESDITGLVSDLAAKAPAANPTLTGTVTMPVPTLPSQAQSAVFAAPSSGAGAPSFRSLVAGDIPAIAESGVTGLVSDLALKAPLASPAFTGVPTVPTATAGTNTTQAASTAFVLANLPAVPVTSVAGKTGVVTLVESDVANLTTDLAALAPLASPTFTGTVTVPAVSVGDGSNVALGVTTGTKIGTATTQKLGFYNAAPVAQPSGNVLTALANLGLVASPTLTESNVANLTTDLAAKAPLASPTFTGTVTVPAVSVGDGSNVALGTVTGTQVGTASTQKLGFYGATPVVQQTGNLLTALSNLGLCTSGSLTESNITNLVSDLALKAPLASPALTGTPTVPTATVGTNTTQAASTAFVLANLPAVPVASVAGKTGAVTLAESDIGSLVSDLAAKAPLASPTFTGTVALPAVTISDGSNVVLGATTGTKIGTTTTQKLGFYNAAPVVQQTGDIVTALANLGLVASGTISEADVTNLSTDLAAKAPLASPTFTGTVTVPAVSVGDGSNIALGTTTGTKIGTGTTQKLGFYNATPVVQQTGNIITALSNLGLCTSGTLTESNVTNLTTDLAAKAPTASPTFTGTTTVAAVSVGDGSNVALGTTTGTKIGTATTQKLGFFNATPVVQPTGNLITAVQNLGLVASATITEANVTNLVSDLAALAPLASPTFTGTVTLPTVSATGATTLQPSASATTPLKCIAAPGTSTTRGVHIKAAPSASPSSTVFHMLLEDESSHVAAMSYDGTNVYLDTTACRLQNAGSGTSFYSQMSYDGTFMASNNIGQMIFGLNNPVTSGATPVLILQCSGVNFPQLPYLSFQGNSSTTGGRTAAYIGSDWAVSTDATRQGRIRIFANDYNSLREGIRVDADGSQAKLSFFGAGAVAKPTVTGSKGGNAALASLLTALANLGLITDSST